MAQLKIFSTGICPICDKTKLLLNKWGIAYDEIRIDTDMEGRREFIEKTNGARTVPQITIHDQWIGGFSELTELHMEGSLSELME
ncbi:MAG: glutaredoxin [Gammaproteobacteria bacterium]|nr:glutaredoxin [Gammaproteobacteria bacterium]